MDMPLQYLIIAADIVADARRKIEALNIIHPVSLGLINSVTKEANVGIIDSRIKDPLNDPKVKRWIKARQKEMAVDMMLLILDNGQEITFIVHIKGNSWMATTPITENCKRSFSDIKFVHTNFSSNPFAEYL